jgi:hypothetical protein
MKDTSERREITRFVNAKESEAVQKSTTLASQTEQGATKTVEENRTRKRRNVLSKSEKKPTQSEDQRRDQAASERMVDEGDPNPNPRP